MTTKVKIFYSDNTNNLQKQVNEFLLENKNKIDENSIQTSITYTTPNDRLISFIMSVQYREYGSIGELDD